MVKKIDKKCYMVVIEKVLDEKQPGWKQGEDITKATKDIILKRFEEYGYPHIKPTTLGKYVTQLRQKYAIKALSAPGEPDTNKKNRVVHVFDEDYEEIPRIESSHLENYIIALIEDLLLREGGYSRFNHIMETIEPFRIKASDRAGNEQKRVLFNFLEYTYLDEVMPGCLQSPKQHYLPYTPSHEDMANAIAEAFDF